MKVLIKSLFQFGPNFPTNFKFSISEIDPRKILRFRGPHKPGAENDGNLQIGQKEVQQVNAKNFQIY